MDGAGLRATAISFPSVEIPGKGTHDVLFVATEHDSVYAFDANQPQRSSTLEGQLPRQGARHRFLSQKTMVQCPFIRPEVGITSTPVIDIKTGTLYVLARTEDPSHSQRRRILPAPACARHHHRCRKVRRPETHHGIGARPGRRPIQPARSTSILSTKIRAPRSLLANNNVYLTWASSCDVDPYHGWVMAYDPQTLAQKAVLNVNPDGSEAGIWLSDTGPAVDSEGNLYVPTGNGTFDATSGGRDYGDSVLKLDGSSLADPRLLHPVRSSRASSHGDSDVGSSGPTLLPDQPGPHRHLLLQPTKHSTTLRDRSRPNGKISRRQRRHPARRIHMAGEGYGAMAYWNGHVFFAASDDSVSVTCTVSYDAYRPQSLVVNKGYAAIKLKTS